MTDSSPEPKLKPGARVKCIRSYRGHDESCLRFSYGDDINVVEWDLDNEDNRVQTEGWYRGYIWNLDKHGRLEEYSPKGIFHVSYTSHSNPSKLATDP